MSIPRKSYVNIWIVNNKDSLGVLKWSYKAYQRDTMIWEARGIAIQKDTNSLELFIQSFSSIRTKWDKSVEKKTKKEKPYYLVITVNGLIFIENKQGGKTRRLQMIKK